MDVATVDRNTCSEPVPSVGSVCAIDALAPRHTSAVSNTAERYGERPSIAGVYFITVILKFAAAGSAKTPAIA